MRFKQLIVIDKGRDGLSSERRDDFPWNVVGLAVGCG